MKTDKIDLWNRFESRYKEFPEIGLSLDLSRMDFPENYFQSMKSEIKVALESMAGLEKGEISNPDETRMVGHYWLRNSALAPTKEIKNCIDAVNVQVKSFSQKVHNGLIKGQRGNFKNILVIGIGGSALGPQFVSHALSHSEEDQLRILFLDNTDPDGFDRVLTSIKSELGQTLCLVISKSGGTKETRNAMLEVEVAYRNCGLEFPKHAVAITKAGSALDSLAQQQAWLDRFPMWDWVGGRTSETSAVGLLPAALQGFEIDSLIEGARKCDELTRNQDPKLNPSMLMALSWFWGGKGKGQKDMVILPYKDRLELFSKYMQQLVMESLGKKKNLKGKVVHQGLTVYGNKGSTDQHAYIQQLRDGLHNFFVVFLQVLHDRDGKNIYVEDGVTAGDYLFGFLMGTRQALYEEGRESVTIVVERINSFSIGVLIALFERAVGFYASMIGINPYHQPGVEAGKKAAEEIITLQRQICSFFEKRQGEFFTALEIGEHIGIKSETEHIFKICQHLAANPGRDLIMRKGDSPSKTLFSRS